MYSRRLLIRDQALSTTFSWAPNPTEQSLHAFWSHVGQYYFKSLKEDDMERLELLMKGSHLENKSKSLFSLRLYFLPCRDFYVLIEENFFKAVKNRILLLKF